MPQNSACESKRLTASGIVTAVGKAGLLYGYSIKIGNTARTNIEFRDGTITGTVKWEDGELKVSDIGDKWIRYAFVTPMLFSTDIYMKITAGTNVVVCVAFVQMNR